MTRQALFFGIAMLALPSFASAASVTIDPSSAHFGRGETFIETVRLTTDADCINAAEVTISYPPSLLRAVDFSRGDSILTLWAVEPRIDTAEGTITFAGGIPGGYCGRISGDAGLSNVLGEVVFTAVGEKGSVASVSVASSTSIYLNDGAGTKAPLTLRGSTITITDTISTSTNPWLAQIKDDTTPPQPFSIDVESTAGVFGGRYYIVFSTTDKESGIDHYDIAEGNGWKRVVSPYVLPNQSLFGVGSVSVRAVDKAGNIRLGTFNASSTPQRAYTAMDYLPFAIILLLLLLLYIKHWYTLRHPPVS